MFSIDGNQERFRQIQILSNPNSFCWSSRKWRKGLKFHKKYGLGSWVDAKPVEFLQDRLSVTGNRPTRPQISRQANTTNLGRNPRDFGRDGTPSCECRRFGIRGQQKRGTFEEPADPEGNHPHPSETTHGNFSLFSPQKPHPLPGQRGQSQSL